METKRYVRTEGGLIVDTQDTFPFMIVDGWIDFNSFGRFKIKRTGDSIEEVCDKFVLVDEEDEAPIERELIGKRYRAMLDELKFRISTGSDPRKLNLYGAIWTDKGLIYVAELNGKGELELMW